MKIRLFVGVVTMLIAVLITGCAAQNVGITPVEQQQIENVVKEYFVRNSSIPEYDVTIEAVEGNWARVALTPSGADEATLVYLQNRTAADEAPTASVDEDTGNDGRVTSSSGWTIVLGPQARFSESALDKAGIPNDIRP